ncbi:MAG: DUF669 domain-containing protein [Planctomycetes bacterium]|nr:DUF669 domain-containing protein [Planctomycetota bacterium]
MHESSNGHVPAGKAIDLTQFDDEFAEAPIEERAFEEVPDGKYQVNVEKVELVHAKTSGNPMLRWELKIVAPHSQGRVLFRHNVLATRENLKWLKNDLHICGLDLEKVSDLPSRMNALLDVKLEVTKRTKGENSNVYFNRRIVLDGSTPGRDAGYDAAAGEALAPF